MITRALTEKATFGKGLRERREPALLTPGGEYAPEEGAGDRHAKALGWKHGQHFQGAAGRPVGLGWSERVAGTWSER